MSASIEAGIDWTVFAYSLADVLNGLREDATFGLEVDDGDFDDFGEPTSSRYMQFRAFGPGWLRCEVVSNAFLPPEHQFKPEQEQQLADMGWSQPGDEHEQGSPNHYLDVETVWVDFVADLAVRVFRDIWSVDRIEQIVGAADDMRRFRWLAVPDGLSCVTVKLPGARAWMDVEVHTPLSRTRHELVQVGSGQAS